MRALCTRTALSGARFVATFVVLLLAAASAVSARGQVVISEIMYHPVEEPAFNADGSPVLELYDDVHEYVEIHNAGTNDVDLAGWKLGGGIGFTFPDDAVIHSGEYLVVAKDPVRLSAVGTYGLQTEDLHGPYRGQLGNRRDTVRLRDTRNNTIDSVSYSAEFPWAISADALGAKDDFTGLRSVDYQYRGRSLERVSFAHPANDPANWLASPLPGNPSPGRPNAISLPAPLPVVTSFSVAQESDESPVIRANQTVVVHCGFSSTNGLGDVRLEWFVEDLNRTNEVHTVASMLVDGPAEAGRFLVTVPGQANRSIVRFRFLAMRGALDEVVSPRPDDPYQWHAFFVTPTRSSTRPVYDFFISTKSLNTLRTNISQSPRRVTSPDPPGNPRASWNASEPGLVVFNNVVYEMRAHYHGSRYNRNASANSFQWQFPRYRKFNGVTALMVTDKGQDTIDGRVLFSGLGMPVSQVRWVDLYLNSSGVMTRLEQGEFDEVMLDEFHRRQQALNPDSELEATGSIHKDVGTIDEPGEGPYGRGDGRKLVKPRYWTDLQMYDWTFPLQNNQWRGSFAFKQMTDAYWAARGDSPSRPNPNIPAMRAFFANYFDVEETLDYIALVNWCCPWDDTTQNHFMWQKRNGKWGMLPWDMDAWFGNGDNTPATSSLFIGEVGDPNNNWRGPCFFKDGFIKAFRQELVERFFLLNNTYLHPDNIRAMGLNSIVGFAQARFANVNQRCKLGVFQRPNKPSAIAPVGGGTALPPLSLQATAYSHSADPAPAHMKTTWEIRAVDGSYGAPVWKLAGATNLTSAPIPFAELEFGRTYLWRCTYYDASGHPSVASDEASFTFGPAPAERTLIALDAATLWKYEQSGTDLSTTNWMEPSFDDSAWPAGPGVLGEDSATLPEPIRTRLNLGRMTHYFRTHFNCPADPRGAVLRFKAIVDDGCVIYLNGQVACRLRMDDGPVAYNTPANLNITVHTYEGPFALPATNLFRGDNVLAVEVHQTSSGSSDVLFGLSLEASIPAVSGDVVINELAARNTGSVTNAGKTPDWIELFNNGSQAIDLGGMSLSDDVLNPRRFTFPTNTVIAAQDRLIVWCDHDTNAPGMHTDFELNDIGQTVVLIATGQDGPSVLDYVEYGLQLDDMTIGRIPDGTGSWQLASPSPREPNVAQQVGSPSDLVVNEWMAAPLSGDDWFELYNPASLPVSLGGLHLTDDFQTPTNTRIADLSFIGSSSFTRFVADEKPKKGANHTDFRLSAGGDKIGLYATNGATLIDAVEFGPQASGVSEGRFPDGGANIVAFPATDSPEESNFLPIESIVFSEVLAHTDPPLEDAVELQNIGSAPVDISGWWLSDSRRQLRKFQIPSPTVLQPGDFAVLYEYQFNADTNSPTSFALSSAHGEELQLCQTDSDGDLTGYRAQIRFGATENGISFGRVPISQGYGLSALAHRTFGKDNPVTVEEFRQGRGQTNSYPKVGPIVISEIMYHPPPRGLEDDRQDQFIELCNITSIPVPLYDPEAPTNTWRLRKAVDFDFPEGVVLPPGECLLVVGFDPVANALALVEFQALCGSQTAIYGPFSGALDYYAGNVCLYKPGPAEPAWSATPGFIPYVLVDRVRYSAAAPWPTDADTAGFSLQRIDTTAYGDEPLNWRGAEPTPGEAFVPAKTDWRLTAVPGLSRTEIHLQVTGPTAGTLILQGSNDLLRWTDLQTIVAPDGSAEFIQPIDLHARAQWYRIMMRP